MITIYGALGIPDSDNAFINTYGQTIVEAINLVIADHNDDVEILSAFFIERSTSDHTTRYKLPGNGRLQRRGRQSRLGEVKATGQWDVQFPLEEFGAGLAIDRVSYAYMRMQDLNRYLHTIQTQNLNTLRFEILRALFNNTPRQFVDEIWGTLTVQPLANGDAVQYPPVIGSEQNATSNHYLGVASSAVNFNDATNPIPTLVRTLEQHFGKPTSGSKIVVIVSSDQVASVENLAGFDQVPNRFVAYGENVSLAMPEMFPEGMPPGRVLGAVNGALVVEWDWMPSGYMAAFHLDAPKPLIRRVDPAETGLTPGLQMSWAGFDAPRFEEEWSNRYGLGVGNRLNGVVIDLTAATPNAYTVPAAYA